MKVTQLCPTLCDPMDCPWNFPGQNTGVGSLSLLQGIFPTQGLNPGLPHCRWILYQLSHKGSPRTLEWVAYPFSKGSSRPRNWTGVYCIAGGFFISWAIREAYKSDNLLLNWAFACFWGNRQNQSKWMIEWGAVHEMNRMMKEILDETTLDRLFKEDTFEVVSFDWDWDS